MELGIRLRYGSEIAVINEEIGNIYKSANSKRPIHISLLWWLLVVLELSRVQILSY